MGASPAGRFGNLGLVRQTWAAGEGAVAGAEAAGGEGVAGAAGEAAVGAEVVSGVGSRVVDFGVFVGVLNISPSKLSTLMFQNLLRWAATVKFRRLCLIVFFPRSKML